MLNAIIRALPGSSGELIFTSSVMDVMMNMGDIGMIRYHGQLTYSVHPCPCAGTSRTLPCCSSQSQPHQGILCT